MIRVAEEWEKAVYVIDSLVVQCYYRVLSFISFHFGIDDAFRAAQYLAETKRGGTVYWVVERAGIARWDDVEVFPGIRITIWLFGSKLRRKNTVMARRGWWALYLWDVNVKRLARVLGTYRV